jgi:hypothetical protein
VDGDRIRRDGGATSPSSTFSRDARTPSHAVALLSSNERNSTSLTHSPIAFFPATSTTDHDPQASIASGSDVPIFACFFAQLFLKDPAKLMQVMIDKGDPSRAEMDEKLAASVGGIFGGGRGGARREKEKEKEKDDGGGGGGGGEEKSDGGAAAAAAS